MLVTGAAAARRCRRRVCAPRNRRQIERAHGTAEVVAVACPVRPHPRFIAAAPPPSCHEDPADRNAGPVAAAAVTLTQSLSSSVRWVAVATSQGSCSAAPPLQCTLGTLAPGASATITRVVRPRATGTLTTTATAATTTAEPLTGNNTATAQTTVTRR
ncbi:MAG TPA: hypothetical protein VFQ20_01910 [Burkholderiaceae bacterium]|nr:hypothetical protein [Burkholderiaceae bacterium]